MENREVNFEAREFNELNKETGRDVMVRTFYFRHAEKADGNVGRDEKISQSSISEKGESESIELGDQLPWPLSKGFKITWSGEDRTLETAIAVTSHLQGSKEFKTRKRRDLVRLPESFVKLYLQKWEAVKKDLLTKKGLTEGDYKKLSTGEQAEIAEQSEELIIREWINNNKSELAQLYPIEEAAAQMARMVTVDYKLPKKLKSGSKIDLFRFTHKTIFEPLLMKILVSKNGARPGKLEDIGGSLGLNEGFEVSSSINSEGKENITCFLYRVDRTEGSPKYIKQEWEIDLKELERLADLTKFKESGEQSFHQGKI